MRQVPIRILGIPCAAHPHPPRNDRNASVVSSIFLSFLLGDLLKRDVYPLGSAERTRQIAIHGEIADKPARPGPGEGTSRSFDRALRHAAQEWQYTALQTSTFVICRNSFKLNPAVGDRCMCAHVQNRRIARAEKVQASNSLECRHTARAGKKSKKR